ncbi:hypothetical protein B296_00034435 [Ensete ventricosum]|uniref:Uncharacterized protein n=1 Tax=Ensete ventricosum TaxID=4639 RepID=A0A426XUR4_ENSVE|nr:hypothetical protein B296_00034435 [Ensete ventricosum]
MRPRKVGCVVQRLKELCKAHRGTIRVTGELDCSSANICLTEPVKSEDKVESAIEPLSRLLFLLRQVGYRRGKWVILLRQAPH